MSKYVIIVIIGWQWTVYNKYVLNFAFKFINILDEATVTTLEILKNVPSSKAPVRSMHAKCQK